MKSGVLLKDEINNVKYGRVYWFKNGVFYVNYDIINPDESMTKVIKGRTLYYHRLGTDINQDVIAFKPKSDDEDFSFEVTEEGKYLIIYSTPEQSHTNYHSVSLSELNDDLKFENRNFILVKGKNIYFDVVGLMNGKLLVRSNFNAPNGELYEYDPTALNQGAIFAGQYKQQLMSSKIIGHKVVCFYEDKQSLGIIRDTLGKQLYSWSIPEGYSFTNLEGNIDDNVAYYYFILNVLCIC